MPVRPRIARHRAVATSAVCGLPRTSPSSSNIESPPITIPSKPGIRGDAGRDIRRLAAGEQQHVLVGVEAPASRLPRPAAMTASSSTSGAMVTRLDPGLPQQHEPGGRRRGEADPHGFTVAARPARLWNARGVDASTGSATAGDELDLDVTGVAHGGVFVGRHGADPTTGRGGRVVFVPDAIPGERVRVRLTDVGEEVRSGAARRSRSWTPRRTGVRTSGAQADVDVPPRAAPGRCGLRAHRARAPAGRSSSRCSPTRCSASAASSLPVDVPAPARRLRRDGELARETPDGTGWRTRVSLHVDADGRVGPFAARSHRVIPVDDLPLATAGGRARRAAARAAAGPAASTSCSPPTAGCASSRRARLRRRAGAAPRRGEVGRPSASGGRGSSASMPAGSGRCTASPRDARTARRVATAARGRRRRADGVLDPDAWHLDLYGGVGLFAATLGELGGAPA